MEIKLTKVDKYNGQSLYIFSFEIFNQNPKIIVKAHNSKSYFIDTS